MNGWKLDEPSYRVLNAYVGCGNVPQADILVFGNEEGTGGYSVEANVKARVELFGKRENETERSHCIVPGNWEAGFYEPSAKGGGSKVEHFLTEGESVRKNDFTAGVFNASIARICLSLESDDGTDWFGSAAASGTAYGRIKDYIGNHLYKVREQGIQTALVDWRPLPRNNERIWPGEYAGIAVSPYDKPAENNPYLDVYNKPKGKYNPFLYPTASFSDFKKDMLERKDRIKRVFERSSAQVVIGIGGATGFKKTALELMFGDNIFRELAFSVDMRNTKGHRQKAFHATIPLSNKMLHVFLIPFPDVGKGFKTHQDALGMLKELSQLHIKPLVHIRK